MQQPYSDRSQQTDFSHSSSEWQETTGGQREYTYPRPYTTDTTGFGERISTGRASKASEKEAKHAEAEGISVGKLVEERYHRLVCR